ncbi:fimbrial assembly protein [Paraburkholderia sp. MMS20-SJTN17]|uniref:Fimbrial assembly protein n=1 Tax=Paraburkholderia translucens TaxID=2886945 RepID=A0ABS8KJZ8_9BURK|nr:fimbrial assembly protein [Paraburkholderia sp. MMS20-SJTN17]MCC8405073.1 fimbrial assembly protein [Paraburkholderia sp. MMS20-SJTN17]
MIGGLSFSSGATADSDRRDPRAAVPWLGGFNLLPYRQRNARLARRRCMRDWAVAACVGAAGVLLVAGWQSFAAARLDARLDARRESANEALTRLAAPLEEHARLLRAEEERRKAAARAASLATPLVRLRDLLDALSFEPGGNVVLRQLRQREHETEVLATSSSHIASAEWLKRLGSIHGVQGAEMRDLHRPAGKSGTSSGQAIGGPVEFDARLRWGDPPPKATRALKAAQTGGAR